jgi:hypothetical protein
MALPDCLQHVFFENEVPSAIGQQLENIYQSPFSTIRYFEIFRGAKSLNALVISDKDSEAVHVLAYIISGREITVLNELTDVEQDYVEYFADTVFKRYPHIATLNINRLKTRMVTVGYPWRLWQTSQDIVLKLPRSFDEYHGKLGRQTQKHIKYYINRFHREQGGFAFQVFVKHEIDPSSISKIIELNRLRMKSKNVRSGFDNLLEKRIMDFCRYYGSVSTLSIDGRIVAGAICYEVGNQAYLEAISHDPDFNKYNAGQVCLYLTIKSMIESGRDSFHMLWGENEYKYRFLGEKQDLYFVSIYRTSSAKLLSMPKLMCHTYSRAVRQLAYLTNKYIINLFHRIESDIYRRMSPK